MTFSYVIAAEARADIRDILVWSQLRFGDAVRDGYEELIFTAISDIAADPDHAGVRSRREIGDGVKSWHLALSRDHVAAGAWRIRTPRHFVIFRVIGEEVCILRLLHDAMDPPGQDTS